MLKYNAFLYAGDVLLDILKDRKGIVFSDDQKRKFKIGLLCSDDATPWFLKEIGLFLSRSDPFYLGLCFNKFLEKKLRKKFSERNKVNDDDIFAEKHKLILPNIKPYFKTCIGVSMSNYLSEYEKYEKGEKIVAIHVDEIKLIEYAESFYRWNFWRIWKLRCQKKFDSGKKSVRWNADGVKREYYKKCWNTICVAAYGTAPHAEVDCFFEALLTELDDINASSNKMRAGWDNDEKNVILASFLVTFVTSTAAASNLKDEGDSIYGLISLFLSIFSALFAAGNTALTMFKSHHAYRETWLRHQLNYSRLTHEIEQFCACIGDYEIESSNFTEEINNVFEQMKSSLSSTTNYNEIKESIMEIKLKIDDKTSKEQYLDNIKKFQKKISKLRNTDYDNFFSNMDCINYKSEK